MKQRDNHISELEYTQNELECALVSYDDDLAGRDKVINSLTSQMEEKEILQARINAVEEEQAEKESMLLEVQKELEETKLRLTATEEMKAERESALFELRTELDDMQV